MAFSYSDENFTVVGNLCFVHLYVTKTGYSYTSIPPAIKDRMLINYFKYLYVSIKSDGSVTSNSTCIVKDGLIEYTNPNDIAYLNFCFPIDSNR